LLFFCEFRPGGRWCHAKRRRRGKAWRIWQAGHAMYRGTLWLMVVSWITRLQPGAFF